MQELFLNFFLMFVVQTIMNMKYIILKLVIVSQGDSKFIAYQPIIDNEFEFNARIAYFDTKKDAVNLIDSFKEKCPYDNTMYVVQEVYNA